MYAVIEASGAQHRVEEGEILRLDKMETPPASPYYLTRCLQLARVLASS